MINLTQHAITLRTVHGDITFPPSGTIARVSTVETIIGFIDVVPSGVPETDEQGNTNCHRIAVVSRSFGDVEGLPPEGVQCIVSSMVADAVPGRIGVFAPDSGKTAVRNDKGLVIAVTRLVAA